MNSTNPQALYMQAMQAYQAGQLAQAEKLLREVVRLMPQLLPVQAMYGGVLAANGKAKEAVKVLRKVLAKDPNHIDALVNLSSALKAKGSKKEALDAIQKAVRLSPKRADIQYNAANILMSLDLEEEAEKGFQKAWELDGNLIVAALNLGMLQIKKQNTELAISYFEKVLAKKKDFAPALINLGNVFADLGKVAEAENIYQKLIQYHPKNETGYYLLGKLLMDQAKFEEAKVQLEKSLKLNAKNEDALILLGNLAKEQQQVDQAEQYYEQALQLNPNNQGAKQNLGRVLQAQIPGWHFTMLADTHRNDAYQKVIEKVVKPESNVLDIGTGTGLLAMMAARAGAKKVVACEMHSKLASTAEAIVKANDYAQQITIFNQKSTELSVGKELGQKCDILIAEILDVGVIGEGVLPTYRHAQKALLTDNAKIIPAKANIYGQLIEIPHRSKINPIKTISGFDLSLFNKFQVENEYKTVHLANEEHRNLSNVQPIKFYDFYNIPPAIQDNEPVTELLNFKIEETGEVQAVAFWFDLHLDEEIMVSSAPNGELKHWGQALFCFPQPKKVKVGDEIQIKLIHSDQLISFAL